MNILITGRVNAGGSSVAFTREVELNRFGAKGLDVKIRPFFAFQTRAEVIEGRVLRIGIHFGQLGIRSDNGFPFCPSGSPDVIHVDIIDEFAGEEISLEEVCCVGMPSQEDLAVLANHLKFMGY